MARRKEERTQLREVLGHGHTYPDGERIVRSKWDEARCIRWTLDTYAPEVGLSLELADGYRILREAAEKSPIAVNAEGERAIAKAETILGKGSCRGTFLCFQLRKRAELDAARDLRTFGRNASPGAVAAYMKEIGSWRSLLPTQADTDQAVARAEREAPPDLLALLPRLIGDPETLAFRMERHEFEEWISDVRLVCQMQVMWDRALAFREEYLELSRAKLPSRERFRIELEARVLEQEERGFDSNAMTERGLRLLDAVRAIEGVLEDLEAPDFFERVTTLKTALKSLVRSIAAADQGTEEEKCCRLHVGGFVVPLLRGVLHSRPPDAAGRAMQLQHTLAALPSNLLALAHKVECEKTDRMVGSSLALCSEWRLRTVKRRLQEADFLLQPLGSFLSRAGSPKQLQVRYALDAGLRERLSNERSEFARSRVIAAVFQVYARSALGSPGEVELEAQNAIEKLRRRIPGSDSLKVMNELRRWREWP